MSGVLRHRGLEAWLEDSNDSPIALSEDANIDLNTISTWVNVTPSQYYTLRWRAIAGCDPCSALCNVYVADGFHSVDSKPFCVSTIIMDSTRRITQSKTTKGWLNSPYNRLGCLRICGRMLTDDESIKKRRTRPGILLLGSLRLEIRRVSGNIHKDQVYWGKGPDGMGVCVFDPDGIEVDDNAARGDPPWIVFEFKFRKVLQVTQHITEENVDTKIGIQSHLKTSRKSSSARPSDSDCEDQLDNSDDDSNNECHISKTKAKEGPPKPDSSGANITQGKRPHDVKNSMERVNSTKLHTSTSDSLPNKLDTSRPRPSQQDKASGYPASSPVALPSFPASSPLALPAIGRAEGIPDVISLIGPSTHTSLRPHIPRDEIVSNVKLVAPDSGLNLYVAASQSKVAHPPSPPPTTDVAAAAAAFPSDSHNSPVPTTCETDSHIQPLTVCEPEMASRIESSEGGDRPVTPPTRSKIANKDNQISRKGKRKIFDGGDTNSCVPAGDGGFKRRKTTMVAEDDSDIEYIGSWTPGKIRTKNIIQTAVKMENLSDGPLPPTVKCEMTEIKFEDNDHKIFIDQIMGDYDALKRKKEELKQKLAEKMEAEQREIKDLLQRLGD